MRGLGCLEGFQLDTKRDLNWCLRCGLSILYSLESLDRTWTFEVGNYLERLGLIGGLRGRRNTGELNRPSMLYTLPPDYKDNDNN